MKEAKEGIAVLAQPVNQSKTGFRATDVGLKFETEQRPITLQRLLRAAQEHPFAALHIRLEKIDAPGDGGRAPFRPSQGVEGGDGHAAGADGFLATQDEAVKAEIAFKHVQTSLSDPITECLLVDLNRGRGRIELV